MRDAWDLDFETLRPRFANTYLPHAGGIEPLATGAARAAALSTAPASLDLLRLAVTSKTPSVALVAAQALTARKDLESLPLLQALHSRIDARRRPAVQRMLDELSPPTKVIEDLVDEDL